MRQTSLTAIWQKSSNFGASAKKYIEPDVNCFDKKLDKKIASTLKSEVLQTYVESVRAACSVEENSSPRRSLKENKQSTTTPKKKSFSTYEPLNEGISEIHSSQTNDNQVEAGVSIGRQNDSPHESTESAWCKKETFSEYEKRRIERIKRNEAKLHSLGLLKVSSLPCEKLSVQRSRKRLTPTNLKQLNVPTRRSKRIMKMDGDYVESLNQKERDISIAGSLQLDKSPLFRSYKKKLEKFACNTQVIPREKLGSDYFEETGPRLLSPTEMYSIDWYQQTGLNGWNFVVGAGKGGTIAIWKFKFHKIQHSVVSDIEPIFSWKGHGNRWISSSQFIRPQHWSSLPTVNSDKMIELNKDCLTKQDVPLLLTAGNDASLCLWDLSSLNVATNAPKILMKSEKSLHQSGIFCMDTLFEQSTSDEGGVIICTGSKDKTIALSSLNRFNEGTSEACFWRSHLHSGKVGSVMLHRQKRGLLASGGDDGLIAIHDYRMKDGNGVVAELDSAHDRPHSVNWNDVNENLLMTAGFDALIKIWDIRMLKYPYCTFQGHVNTNTKKLRNINRPMFYTPKTSDKTYVVTGGEGSGQLSLYSCERSPCLFHENGISNVLEKRDVRKDRLSFHDTDPGCIGVFKDIIAVCEHDIFLFKMKSSKIRI